MDARGTDAIPDAAAADAREPPPIDAAFGSSVVGVEGDIAPVHDPAIFATPSSYYIYSTGEGISVRASTDLVTWRLLAPVFASKPSWITTTDPGDPNNLWAPDLSYFGGQYHLYYAASSFGSNTSCIGHATSPSLDVPVWEDHGSVICSDSTDDWNAIDPAAFVDQAGGIWLALGSFWSGLKLIQLDSDGNQTGTDFIALATRANTAVEAPYLVYHGGFYYLFESVDFCCNGLDSNYKIMVGRSADITGPYLDQTGTPLMTGGGTLILAGDARWIAPGHNAVLETAAGSYNVYHALDAQADGTPTLRIAQLRWSADGWPLSAGP